MHHLVAFGVSTIVLAVMEKIQLLADQDFP